MRTAVLLFTVLFALAACTDSADAPKPEAKAETASEPAAKPAAPHPMPTGQPGDLLRVAEYEEGKHYTIIPGQPEPSADGKITVTEVFWYGCSHCFTFEPLVSEWKKGLAEDVEFVGSPAMWQLRVEPADMMWTHAKLYYAAKQMGVLDKVHLAFFEALNKQGKRLVNPEEIKKLVSEHGVDGDLFIKTMDSDEVSAQVKLADQRQRTYRVTGTPELAVSDYYHITSKAGSHEEMLNVADYLIKKVRKTRK